MVGYLARDGIPISRDRVRKLMRRMGLRAIYQKPRTTVPGDPSERFPCLVDLSTVTAVDQVWATDITYIPLQKGFLYLVSIVDLFSRHVLSWKLSNSLDTEFCLEALGMALEGGRKPETFHSDQGCQFTSSDFVARLQAEKIKISWSGRKRCYDNILVERLWRTVKYEEVYLHAYSDGWEAEIRLARFLWRYCHGELLRFAQLRGVGAAEHLAHLTLELGEAEHRLGEGLAVDELGKGQQGCSIGGSVCEQLSNALLHD